MPHSDLGDARSEGAGLQKKFSVHQSAGRAEANAPQNPAVNQLEAAIRIAKSRTEEDQQQQTVDPAEQDPRPALGPPQTIADDQVVPGEMLDKPGQFSDIELHVSVRIKNILFGSGPPAAEQSLAVSAVGPMVDDADLGMLGRQTIGDPAGVIRTAVIDDEDFQLIGELSTDFQAGQSERLDCGFVSVAGKEHRQAGQWFIHPKRYRIRKQDSSGGWSRGSAGGRKGGINPFQNPGK